MLLSRIRMENLCKYTYRLITLVYNKEYSVQNTIIEILVILGICTYYIS